MSKKDESRTLEREDCATTPQILVAGPAILLGEDPLCVPWQLRAGHTFWSKPHRSA